MADGNGFHVDTETLSDTATAIRAVADTQRGHRLSDLVTDPVSYGDGDVHVAFTRFASRWSDGLDILTDIHEPSRHFTANPTHRGRPRGQLRIKHDRALTPARERPKRSASPLISLLEINAIEKVDLNDPVEQIVPRTAPLDHQQERVRNVRTLLQIDNQVPVGIQIRRADTPDSVELPRKEPLLPNASPGRKLANFRRRTH